MIAVPSAVPYAIALLLLKSVSKGSCYQITKEATCFKPGKVGVCVPVSECEEVSAILNGPIMRHDARKMSALEKACGNVTSTVPLVCCFNPFITIKTSKLTISTTRPSTTEERTNVKSKKYKSLVPKTCGNPPVQDGTFGWTVLIGTGHFYRRCVGTLISDGFVLTAAHCVYGVEPNNITLLFGSVHVLELPQCLSTNYDCHQVLARKLWIHKKFVPSKNAFNVALIKTAVAIKGTWKSYVYPICLPLNTTEEDTDQAKRHILRPRIYDATNGIQEACGYSGAPIVVMDNATRYQVVGVANHPVDCDRKRVKRDATPLLEYVDWILNILTYGKEHVEPW